MTSPRTCSASETTALLPFDRLMVAVERAAIDRADGSIVCPERTVVALANGATMLSMPAVAADVAIHKLITVAPRNAAKGLPTIHGAMTVFDPATGRPLFVLDGPTVTGRRTAAVSMCALRRLARADARRVLLFGTGAQAGHHLDALATLRPDWRVRVRGRTRAAAQAFTARHRESIDDLDVADAADEAEADIVVTCTTSTTPVYETPARAGVLVIAVGSFRPDLAEIGATTVRSSAIVVDDLVGARHEAGDLITAGIDWNDVVPFVDLIRDARRVGDRPPLFKSVGCAAWDLAAARVAMETYDWP